MVGLCSGINVGEWNGICDAGGDVGNGIAICRSGILGAIIGIMMRASILGCVVLLPGCILMVSSASLQPI